MHFDSLKDKCYYYRSLSDTRLIPNSYIILMLDGRSFSSKIKSKFNLPFDDDFVEMMNLTARYLCKNITGARFAFTQSDEISILISDIGIESPFFQNRCSKLISLASAMATSKFNQLMMAKKANEKPLDHHDILVQELYEFDCKVWNVPSPNEVYAWFLFRQIDCIRNSKLQAAQTYIPNKRLFNMTADEQISLLEKEKGIVWNNYPAGLRNGRRIVKREEERVNEERDVTYTRGVWEIEPAPVLFGDEEKKEFMSLIPEQM